jgi:hypothetical protein
MAQRSSLRCARLLRPWTRGRGVANRVEFRSGNYEEIMNNASCLSLLSNAVLGWNTVAIMRIVTQLRAAGDDHRG